ncbi:MAG: hypothetical protein H6502_02045 [Candidatus Woesearchaeota archaeon]|nr:MAG: hypothetical protein H6502_02045 [Candidatus Woesearchaeota archaeon]
MPETGEVVAALIILLIGSGLLFVIISRVHDAGEEHLEEQACKSSLSSVLANVKLGISVVGDLDVCDARVISLSTDDLRDIKSSIANELDLCYSTWQPFLDDFSSYSVQSFADLFMTDSPQRFCHVCSVVYFDEDVPFVVSDFQDFVATAATPQGEQLKDKVQVHLKNMNQGVNLANIEGVHRLPKEINEKDRVYVFFMYEVAAQDSWDGSVTDFYSSFFSNTNFWQFVLQGKNYVAAGDYGYFFTVQKEGVHSLSGCQQRI